MIMRSSRRRCLRKECRPSRRSRSSYNSRWKPFTSLVANRWNCSKQMASVTRFGEQACITFSRWGRTYEFLKGSKRGYGQFSKRPPQTASVLLWRQPLCNGWRVKRNCFMSPGLYQRLQPVLNCPDFQWQGIVDVPHIAM